MQELNDKLNRILDASDRTNAMLEALLAGKKSARRKVNPEMVPPVELQKHREAEVLRIFTRLATAKHFQKTAQYFPKCIIQPREQDARPLEAVPLSILLNRLEMLKAFWPTVKETHLQKSRDVVSHVLGALFHRGDLERGNCQKLYPQGHESDVEIVMSAKEAKFRRDWLNEGDDEGVVVKPKVEDEPPPPRIMSKKGSKPLWPGQNEEDEA